MKQEGKSKLANILFLRAAARDGDATAFAVADVRLPAQTEAEESFLRWVGPAPLCR